MKLLKVFGLVVAFHMTIGGILLVQSGCQTTQGDPNSAFGGGLKTVTEPEPQIADNVDAAFNSGVENMDSAVVVEPPQRYKPTRPAEPLMTESFDDAFNSGQDVLSPLDSDTGDYGSYVVEKGDTLSKIARKMGVSLNSLLAANELNKNSTIFPDQELIVPAGGVEPPVSAPEKATEYQVVAGDSLSVIAHRFGSTVRAIKQRNGLSSDVIRVGQTLTVPGSGYVVEATSAPAQTAALATGGKYRVRSGDTPGGIAHRFGIHVKDLMRANNITDPRKLRAGKEIIIPGVNDIPSAKEDLPVLAPEPISPKEDLPDVVIEEADTLPVLDSTLEASDDAPVMLDSVDLSGEPGSDATVDSLEQLENLDINENDIPAIEVQEVK